MSEGLKGNRRQFRPLPLISVMAAMSDVERNPQSAAARKTEGSLWETVLRACGFRPEAQHPRLDGKGWVLPSAV